MHNRKFSRYMKLSLSLFCAIAACIVLYFSLLRMQGISSQISKISGILAPFIYGAVMAYLLRPCCNVVEKELTAILPGKQKHFAAPAAVLISLIVGFLVVYAVIIMIVPQLVTSVVTIWNATPGRISQLIAWAETKFADNEQLVEMVGDRTEELYNEVSKWVQQKIVPQATLIFSGVGMSVVRVFKFLYNLLVGIIVAVYLLGGRHKFAKQGTLLIRSTLPSSWADILLDEIELTDRMFNGFINGKIVDSSIIGLLCYIGCALLRFPNPVLLAAIIGVTNVIPFFGPFIGAVPATLLILIEDPMKALWFIIFVLILQQLDGNVIGPKILGDRTGIAGFWVMFAIILFGGLWGLVGMVIAVPLFAVFYNLVKRFIYRGLKKKDNLALWENYRQEFPSEQTENWSNDPLTRD